MSHWGHISVPFNSIQPMFTEYLLCFLCLTVGSSYEPGLWLECREDSKGRAGKDYDGT